MTTYSGDALLNFDGEAIVYLPIEAMTMDATILVSPYYRDDNHIPVVAATKPMGGMFKIRELNHTPCLVAWAVYTRD